MSKISESIKKWEDARANRERAEKWASAVEAGQEISYVFAGIDAGGRSPDSFNKALASVIERDCKRFIREALAELAESERRAFFGAMPYIDQLADAAKRFKSGSEVRAHE